MPANRIHILSILLLALSPVLAYDEEFSTLQRIEPPAVYGRIEIRAGDEENRLEHVYRRKRSLSLYGEIPFLEHFSLSFSGGTALYNKTDTAPMQRIQRPGIGLKGALNGRLNDITWAFGGGILCFDSKEKDELAEGEVSGLYLVRPHLEAGLKMDELELVMSLHMESETNKKFREDGSVEFRRHYQIGLGVSWGISETCRLLAETEYREPYSGRIDVDTRYWHFYPGIQYELTRNIALGASLQIPLLHNNTDRRGVLFTITHRY